MKALYFDCFSGISGDMTIGALLDLGIDKDEFEKELSKINVDGYTLTHGRTKKNGISAYDFDVILEHDHHHEHEGHNHNHEHEEHHHHHEHEGHDHHHTHIEEHSHSHSHHHDHIHRNLYDVNKIIDDSEISENAKDLAKRIFLRVAKAESKVHNETLENVHFHEVGAIDSIVDIIGVAICIDMLKPEKIFSSVVNDGHGFIKCQHGIIPVPVPATAEIFADSNVIFKQVDVENELVTPTGAAIIAELAESYGIMPAMNIEKVGFGAGKKDFEIPNILRVTMGEI